MGYEWLRRDAAAARCFIPVDPGARQEWETREGAHAAPCVLAPTH